MQIYLCSGAKSIVEMNPATVSSLDMSEVTMIKTQMENRAR